MFAEPNLQTVKDTVVRREIAEARAVKRDNRRDDGARSAARDRVFEGQASSA